MTKTYALGIPKGDHVRDDVLTLLKDAGYPTVFPGRKLETQCGKSGLGAFLVQNADAVTATANGNLIGCFAGRDTYTQLWLEGAIDETSVVALLDTQLAPSKIVTAVKASGRKRATLPKRSLRVASQLGPIAKTWLQNNRPGDTFIAPKGSMEIAPELYGAEAIIDRVDTGATLAAHGWRVADEIGTSSLMFYANRKLWEENKETRASISTMLDNCLAVINARNNCLLKCNVTGDLDTALDIAGPGLGSPTVMDLRGGGHAIEVVVPNTNFESTRQRLIQAGATGVIQTYATKIYSDKPAACKQWGGLLTMQGEALRL